MAIKNTKSRIIQLTGIAVMALYVLVPMGIIEFKPLYFFTVLPGSLILLYGTWKEYKEKKS